MRRYIETHTWSKPEYRAAVESAAAASVHVQHPAGLAVHDVGEFRSAPLRPGLVFTQVTGLTPRKSGRLQRSYACEIVGEPPFFVPKVDGPLRIQPEVRRISEEA